MTTHILLAGVLMLAFLNGANDNFKGVATLWGTGRYRYGTVLVWAALATFAGAVFGGTLAGGLARVFSGSDFLGKSVSVNPLFLASVALGAVATLLLATWIGTPISTTHALAGSLVGAGMLAVGADGVKWLALVGAVAVPLLLSPLLAMGLTLGVYPPLARWFRARSCICLTEAAPMALSGRVAVGAAPGLLPVLRVAHRADCERGDELTRWNTEELVHWASAGLISFSRGLNDTPKIATLMLSAGLLAPQMSHVLVAAAMAAGGLLAAHRVARTMSKRITLIEPLPGMTANLVGTVLVGAASGWGLPVDHARDYGGHLRRGSATPRAHQLVFGPTDRAGVGGHAAGWNDLRARFLLTHETLD
jgi:PiT family inorganic phosphate transporter